MKLVALTLRLHPKWLDNLLSRQTLPGVAKSRQGIERRIFNEGLLTIELVRILNVELGVSLERACAIARSALDSRRADTCRFTLPSGVELDFPLPALERRLRERMMDAVESLARVPRGRPPRARNDQEA